MAKQLSLLNDPMAILTFQDALDDYNFIVDGLAQGGFPRHDAKAAGWSLIVSHSRNFNAHPVPYLHFPFDDTEIMLPDTKILHNLAKLIAHEYIKQDKRVLIHCDAGLNRSGLTTALVLLELGYKPQDAINLMRKQRCQEVLYNDRFRNYIMEQQR